MNSRQQDITLRQHESLSRSSREQCLRLWLSSLRVKHWLKNILLFAAPFFGGRFFSHEALSAAIPAFFAFSFCASAGYVINDLKDAAKDGLHPIKKKRPIASGRISKRLAVASACVLAVSGVTVSLLLGSAFTLYLLTYFLVQSLYSFYFKNIPLLDIFSISTGFVLRVLAGGAAFHVEVSQWLFVTMFMISLTLASGKRLGEFRLLQEKAGEHRESLNQYSTALLNEILIVCASASLLTYSLYTVEQSKGLVYTVPVVVLGLFRYIMVSRLGLGDPTEALTKDRWLAMIVVLWLVFVTLVRYNSW